MPTIKTRNSTCVMGKAPDNTVTINTPNAIPTVIADKWIRRIGTVDSEVEAAVVKWKVKILLETENISDDTELIVNLLDAKDNSEVQTTNPITVKLKNNKGDSNEIEIVSDWSNSKLLVTVKK